jgi:hypothetical protein
MRGLKLLLAAAIMFIGASSGVASSATAPALSGKMTQLQYLVGTWTCTTRLPATNKMRAQTITAKSVYWVDSANAIGNYYSSKPYSSSGFMGWMASKKLWWNSGADIFGSVSSETGKDSGTNVHVMTGTNLYQGQVATSRDTMTKISNTSYSDVFQLVQNGAVTFRGTTTCNKVSSTSMWP